MKIRNILGLLGMVAMYVFIKFIGYQVRHYRPDASSQTNSNEFTPRTPINRPATQPGESSADATLAQIFTRRETIKLTPLAAAKIREMAKAEGLKTTPISVRVGLTRTENSRFLYSLDLVEEGPTQNDYEAQSQGIRILLERKNFLYLRGATIDYTTKDGESGFHFTNPKERSPVERDQTSPRVPVGR